MRKVGTMPRHGVGRRPVYVRNTTVCCIYAFGAVAAPCHLTPSPSFLPHVPTVEIYLSFY
jgi:hypothetical protein